jgi:hypothetical protein
LAHPRTSNEATREYAEALYKALSANGKPMPMSMLASKIKKPEGAEKMGKIVAKYECFKRGDEGKSKDIVSLAE